MTDTKINISQTPRPYDKRRTSTFRWTLLIYFIVTVVFGLSSDLGPFLYLLFFLTILFALDYRRRLKWVRHALISLDTDDKVIRLSFSDKDEIKSSTISWDKLNISKGSTFTKNSTRILTIKDGDNEIASFYADAFLDNNKIDKLYKDLKEIKTANA